MIYQQKSRKSLLIYKLSSNVLWMLHYLLLAAYSGAAIAGIGIFRELIFCRLLCSVVSAVFTWKRPLSVLPARVSIFW
ncbi:MAG: YgjV family protein [Lachnospiraceae bacterium]|nr:YgjV family protein [Lachnospiraceae bacterium]